MEMPIKTLERFGLTEEMINDLPETVKRDLAEGRMSPLLPISMHHPDGNVYETQARIMLVPGSDGVMFIPSLVACDLEKFTADERRLLEEGGAIAIDANRLQNDKPMYCQLDKQTNQVIMSPTEVVDRNLETVATHYRLSTSETARLQRGQPLTIIESDREITMGVNLLAHPSGIKIVRGGIDRFNAPSIVGLPRYSFGVEGCWVSDESGSLNYIKEENYTSEMNKALEEMAQKRANGMRM